MAEPDKTTTTTTTDATAAAATTAATTTDKGTAGADTSAAAGASQAATTATTATTAATTTAATTTAATTTAEPKKGYWPDDWQRNIIGADDKLAKDIAKFDSPKAIYESYRALQAKLSAGDLRPALPKDPKPDELTAWRKEHGIPEKPEGYDLADLKIPDKDKPFVSSIVAKLHEANASPDVVKAAVATYYGEQERYVQERLAKDVEERQVGTDALNQEWGGNFRRNVNLVEGLLAKFPSAVRDAIKTARAPDGTLLFNQPDVMRGFLAAALESNPAGIVVPAAGGDLGKTALEEYRDIKKLMRENRVAYNKDDAKQARMRDLIEYLSANELIDANGNEIAARRKAA